MKSLYRVKYRETHTVENFHYFQEKDQRNLHVHYRFDHMENEEHRENMIESGCSKSKKEQSIILNFSMRSYRVFLDQLAKIGKGFFLCST